MESESLFLRLSESFWLHNKLKTKCLKKEGKKDVVSKGSVLPMPKCSA